MRLHPYVIHACLCLRLQHASDVHALQSRLAAIDAQRSAAASAAVTDRGALADEVEVMRAQLSALQTDAADGKRRNDVEMRRLNDMLREWGWLACAHGAWAD